MSACERRESCRLDRDGGLHATEVAHGQAMPEMVHYFVTDESAGTRDIREDTVLLLLADMNPDGLNIVSDWYMLTQAVTRHL